MKQSNQSKNFFFKCAMGVLYICMAENEIYTMDCGDFKSNSFLFYLWLDLQPLGESKVFLLAKH